MMMMVGIEKDWDQWDGGLLYIILEGTGWRLGESH